MKSLTLTLMFFASVFCAAQSCQTQYDAGYACDAECRVTVKAASMVWEGTACYDNVMLPCPCGNQSFGTITPSLSRVCRRDHGQEKCTTGEPGTNIIRKTIAREWARGVEMASVFVPDCSGSMVPLSF